MSGSRSMAAPALLAALWAGLNGLDVESWLVGVPFVLVATLLSWRLVPLRGPSLRWRALPTFVGYFLRESIRGGVDVARRALRPGPPVDPGVVTFSTRLPSGPARTVFSGAIGLLPGTLVLAVTDGTLDVHALDVSADVEGELRDLERRVARLFGIPLEPSCGSTTDAGAPDGVAPSGGLP